jgi:hypothetical protein
MSTSIPPPPAVSQSPIRMQIGTPQAVATLLACPRPPDDLGGRQYDRLAALGRSASSVITLANAVLADYRRQTPFDRDEYPDAAAVGAPYLSALPAYCRPPRPPGRT